MENETAATRKRPRRNMRSRRSVPHDVMEHTPNPDISIDVKNVGPIARGVIDLRPLTVFAGPSNTGKSWMATLLYALGAFPGTPRIRDFPQRFSRYGHPKHFFKILSDSGIDQFPENADQWRHLLAEPRKSVSLTKGEVAVLLAMAQQDNDDLVEEVLRCFGTADIQRLVRITGKSKRSASISINTGPIERKFSIDAIDGIARTDVRFIKKPVLTYREGTNLFYGQGSLGHAVELLVDAESDLSDASLTRKYLPHRIASACLAKFHADRFVNEIHYLPADRGGIMHAHSAIVSSLIRGAARAGIRNDQYLSILSGVVSDFMEQLVDMANETRLRRYPDNSRCDGLTSNVLHGTVDIKTSSIGYPVFVYRPLGLKEEIPLVNASSMISEVGPVSLYMRYIVHPGDLLILEEPEAHLHPSLQQSFAQEIVTWVNSGIRVLLTTHSEWILDEISNVVARGKQAERKNQRADMPVLSSDDIGVWRFDFIDQSDLMKGTKVVEVPWDVDERGYEPGFYSVMVDQYNEWARTTDDR